LPDAATIKPRGRLTRYVVLDQWFRAASVGKVTLRGVIGNGRSALASSFQVEVIPANVEVIEHHIDAMLAKYYKLKAAPVRSDEDDEFENYRFAIEIAFSYLTVSFPDVLHELEKRIEDPDVLRIINEAENMGPGGVRIID
jgi:hypothetical protein